MATDPNRKPAPGQPETQPGELNRRVTFLLPATGQDAVGAPLNTLAEGDTVWARITSAAAFGQSVFETGYVSESRYTIRIRYRRGVTPSMRLRYDAREFNILVVTSPNEARVWLDLICQEVL